MAQEEEMTVGQPGIHGTRSQFELTKNVPAVSTDKTAGEIRALFSGDAPPFDSINYIYFTDKEGELVGVLALKTLFRLPNEKKAFEESEREVVTARASTPAEKVAIRALQNNLKAIPIVDKDNHFLGVMTSDTILHTLHDRNIENVLRSAGVSNPATWFSKSRVYQILNRVPWLIVGLLGSIVAATIITQFEGLLVDQIALAAFIPVIVYITDAIGVQTETLFIRYLTTYTHTNFPGYLFRELATTSLMALFLSGISFIIVSVFWNPTIAAILSFSMLLTIVAATIIAILFPWAFSKSKRVDPAVASGPFGTSLRDISTIVIYFTVATALLSIV